MALLWPIFLLIAGANCDTFEHGRRVVCFLASWGVHLSGEARFDIADAKDAMPMCTHVVYLFASLDGDSFKIKYLDAARDIARGGLAQTVALRKTYPHLKVMIGLGGWNDGSISYSRMSKFNESRRTFVNSVVEFLDEYGFDGLDLNWQFPGDRGGGTEDKTNIVFLVKELREAFDKHNKIISVSVSCMPFRINAGIDGKGLADHAHFLNVLTYEYHSWGEGKVNPGAPLFADDENSIDTTIKRYLAMGVDPDKLTLGLSTYFTTYVLLNELGPNEVNITGQPTKNYAFKGALTGVDGFIAFNELCKETDTPGVWNFVPDEKSKMFYAIKKDNVVALDTPESFAAKIEYAMRMKLGGVIYYGLEKDDFGPYCKSSKGLKFPNLRSIDQALLEYSPLVFEDLLEQVKLQNAHVFWSGKFNQG